MRRKNLDLRLAVCIAALGLAALLIAGCDSSSSTRSTPSSSFDVGAITVSPSSITVGESAVVEAIITNGDEPLPNRVVLFSCTPATAGYFTPSMDTSDANGLVASVFTATQSGSISVTAKLTDDIFNSASLEVAASSQTGSGNVNIDIAPNLLLADGVSTSQVTVTILDIDSDPAPESTQVRLTAGEKFDDIDGNGYFSSGVDSVIYDVITNDTWDAIGFIPSTAYVQGQNGQAVVDYVAGNEAVTVYIRATVNDDLISGYGETQLQLTPNASIESIFLMTDSNSLAVQGTGGMETAQLTAIGYDANGNRVPEGLQISFIITDGPGGGERLGTSGYGPYVAMTNAQGMATCPISSGTISGTIRVRATADTILSNSTLLMVHAGPPAHIVVGAEICNVQAWNWVDVNVEITSLVSDVYNNPVRDSIAVYFSCDEGTIKAHKARTEEEEGRATTEWFSGYNPPTADGIVEIYVETSGGTVADTCIFINSWIPDTIWFVQPGFPSSIVADGKTSRKFYLEVRDLNMNYVLDQTEIDVESYYATVASGVIQDGCYASVVATFLTSVVLDYDYSWEPTDIQDDGIGAIDMIMASYKGMVTAALPCTLTTGPAYLSGCNLDIPSSVNYSTSVPFSVTIKDRWGNPLGGHQLVAGISGRGTISNGVQFTNAYGEATGFLYNAPAVDPLLESETAIIQVQDMDPLGNITLTAQISLSE
ncbi:MAG: hypothetical protein JSV44_11505 [Candidatus Zixiibacteriota bacterium]|nr:MAG: hypothetical protein JSV44_11505 [candidate division Zixibacteria bacterium]